MEPLTLFVIFLAMLMAFIYLENYASNKPPGPLRLPLIGSLWKLAMFDRALSDHAKFKALSAQYGPVCHLKIGVYDTVIIDDFEIMKKILNSEKWVDRKLTPALASRSFYKVYGIIFVSGETWKEMRRFTMRTLRDFGFGKQKGMEGMLEDEVKGLLATIETKLNVSNEVEVKQLFSMHVLNVLWKMVCCVRSEDDDEKLQKLMLLVDKLSRAIHVGGGLVHPFPYLLKLPFYPKNNTHQAMESVSNELHAYFRELLQTRREEGVYKTEQRDYVDVFLREIDYHKENGTHPNFYTDDQFTTVTMDLFEAGADTTKNTLEFGMYYIMHNPKVQKKVQEEIDRVIGRSRLPTWQDKANMPYTEATLVEIQRMANVLPMTVRCPTEDLEVAGYKVKKGTIGFINLYGVHMDENTWKDPDNFRPERFLNENGELIPEMLQRVIPFGGGKRLCLGETLAKATLFIYFTSVLQSFSLQNIDPLPKDYTLFGFTLSPIDYKAKITRRQ